MKKPITGPKAAPASPQKDVIHIDVDDEITDIIDKVRLSKQKIVALVLPKRATALQSIVNMRLLKKTAQNAKKNLVLVTSEPGLMPLAGAVGLYVAPTSTSKPEIPPTAVAPAPDDEPLGDDDEPKLDKRASVGALAAVAAGTADETETIDFDNSPTEPAVTAVAAKPVKPPKGKNRKLKVPNFEKFRLRLFLAIAAVVLLLIAWFMAFVISPRATITLKTDTAALTSTLEIAAATTTKELDLEKRLVPATYVETKKTDTEKVAATGKKGIGTKATGSLTVFNCTDNAVTLPAGTQFRNSNLTFVSDAATDVPASDFFSNGTCKKNASVEVAVSSAEPGDKYNLPADAEYVSPFASTLTGTGSAMTGGTSKIVTVVTQEDVDGAIAKMTGRTDQQGQNELKKQIGDQGMVVIDDTITESAPKVTAKPAVGQEATADVTVTNEITYNALGVKLDDLSRLINKDVEAKIDTAKQSILDNGVTKATIRTINRKSKDEAVISMQTIATAGPKLDEAAIKETAKGRKRGDVQSEIGSLPGIKDVTVDYSPFWVYTTPKAAKKITIVIDKSEAAETSQTDGSE